MMLKWIHRKLEICCVSVIRRCHQDARRKGYNMVAPDWVDPWWFRYVSKAESMLRKFIVRQTRSK